MKYRNSVLIALVSQLVLLAPTFTFAAPHSDINRSIASVELSEAEVMIIKQLITQLSSDDLVQRSAAAQSLGSYPYDEVVTALLRAAKTFLLDTTNENKSYPFTFSNCIESLISIATYAYSAQIIDLENQFDKVTAGGIPTHKGIQPRMAEKWRERLILLKNVMNTREESLPKYSNSVAEKAENVTDLLVNQLDQPLSIDESKTLDELMKDLPPEMVDFLYKGLLSQVDVNHHDKAIKIIQKGKGGRKFYGRQDELEKLNQAFLRIEKGHALLTGKAGVGKTTILKMLTDSWFLGTLPYPGNHPPILLELPITDVTNDNDPSVIKARIKTAEMLAVSLNRHVILMVDEAHVAAKMTRNAIKSFLTQELRTDSHVHFVWLTTSSESRAFLSDTAFSRRWVQIDVREFTTEESIALIKDSYLPLWRSRMASKLTKFSDISDEAYQTAARYAKHENEHSGNPTGLKEILEGAIINKLRANERAIKSGTVLSEAQKSFTLEPEDIRAYLKFHKGLDLIPGDANFEKVFAEKWKALEAEYVGNEGLKYLERKDIHDFFSAVNARRQVFAQIYMGPPGAGKSFLPELVAKHFFNTTTLSINGAKYSEGGLGLNTLIGSPVGVIGSEEQRSILTKYIKDNPRGGVIVFEEADLAHQDVFSFLVDAISKKEFEDGLGHHWNLENFMIILTTNVGQELMVATESSQRKLNWDDLAMRRKSMTEQVYVDGHTVELPKADIMSQLFERFMSKVSKHSNPNVDSGVARTQNEKLERRIAPRYVMPPTREELIEAAYRYIETFIKQQKSENKVTFEIDRSTIEKILDVEHYRVKEGFSFVGAQLDKRLITYLSDYINEKGKTYKISIGEDELKFGKKTLKGQKLVITDSKTQGVVNSYAYGVAAPSSENPWFNSEPMKLKIQNFETEMAKRVMNQDIQIKAVSRMLKQKAMSWSSRVVFSQLGTSGNGKTEFGYSMAEVLYGDRKAAYKISGLNTWADLQNYFRSPTGFVGNNEETEFERWFMARKSMGGGVIILDELLSFYGLNVNEMAEKIKVINKLYDFLDEGTIRFGNRVEDASGFIIEITGNAMQEAFDGIDDAPDSEKLVKLALKDIKLNDIIKYFSRIGIDAAKLARFGQIFVNGPLPKAESLKVGIKDLTKLVKEAIADVSELYDLDVIVDPAVVEAVVKRVSTVRLGMREVNKAIKILVAQPLGEIFFEHAGVEKIELKLEAGKLNWYLDGKLTDMSLPGLDAITEQPKLKIDPNHVQFTAIHELYGHWMVKYLLTRKNDTLSISMIPGDNYLGYVRSLPDKENFTERSLTTYIKEIVELEAGYRAIFIKGLYADGGGSGGNRKKGEAPSDDLGKIEAKINTILSNQLLSNYREFGSHGDANVFKAYMRDLARGMADALIRYGKNTKVFDPLFAELMQNKYLDEGQINLFTKNLPPNKLADKDQIFLWSLSVGITNVLKRTNSRSIAHKNMKEQEIVEYARLSKEILTKAFAEVKTLNKIEGREDLVNPKLNDQKAKILKYIESIVNPKAQQNKVSGTVRCSAIF